MTPETRPAEGGRVPEPGGYAASVAPHPPATPWQPPPIDQPQPSAFDQPLLPASDRPQLPGLDLPREVQAFEHPTSARALGPPRQLRAIIADEIRIPILWCEFGECIECYTDAEALGERDLRARAYAAGWRYDALSRLACPTCVQCDASFWATRPPVLFDRDRYGRPR